MKKILAALFAIVLSGAVLSPAWAEGDKVRGERGQGETRQVGADSQGNQAD